MTLCQIKQLHCCNTEDTQQRPFHHGSQQSSFFLQWTRGEGSIAFHFSHHRYFTLWIYKAFHPQIKNTYTHLFSQFKIEIIALVFYPDPVISCHDHTSSCFPCSKNLFLEGQFWFSQHKNYFTKFHTLHHILFQTYILIGLQYSTVELLYSKGTVWLREYYHFAWFKFMWQRHLCLLIISAATKTTHLTLPAVENKTLDVISNVIVTIWHLKDEYI